ncbi:MAG: hypothetical protein LAN83_09125 [Acidobacteriia bacterium]|nr:hypothetical protein [Terriglobia bacterium]
MLKSELKTMFIHDALRGEQVDLLKQFGTAFYKLAGNIVINTAECPEQMICLRKLQESQQFLYLAVLRSEVEHEQPAEIARQNG